MNLFPRVPIYVASEGLPAVFSCIETLSFLFLLSCGRRARRRSIRRKRFSIVCDGEIARRLPSTSLFPALFRIQPSYYSTFNREKETDFSRHVDFTGATNELSRDWYCEGMYVIAIEKERERDIPRFPIRSCAAAVAVAMVANRRFQFRDVDRMNRDATVI